MKKGNGNEHGQITSLSDEHIPQIAKLHVEGIGTGFISSVGIGFVTALYGALAESKSSFGFVAEENDKIIGFVIKLRIYNY